MPSVQMPSPGRFSRSRWGRSHSAYISESVTVHYPWCNLFQSSLPVLRRMHRDNGDWVICESPDGNAVALPVWMTDESTCAAFSAGIPVVSLNALRELRGVLDALHSASNYDKPSGKTSPLEHPDEGTKKSEGDAGKTVFRSAVSQQSGSSGFAVRSTGRTPKANQRAAAKSGSRKRRSAKRRRV